MRAIRRERTNMGLTHVDGVVIGPTGTQVSVTPGADADDAGMIE